MGLFDKVMDLMFEDDESAGPSKGQSASSRSPSQAQKTPSPTQSPPKAKKTDEKVYKQFVQSLQDVMTANNLPGFDLYEFHRIFTLAVRSGRTVKKAMKQALSSSDTMRVDKESLIKNYDHYSKILDEQKQKFEEDMQHFYDEKIKTPKADHESIDRELDEKIAQQTKLEAEIEELMNKKKALGLDTKSAEEQVDEVKDAFNKAYIEVTSELSGIVDVLKGL